MPAITSTTSASPRSLIVALVGNPNAGKTSLFNALTGAHQRIGNYPGVTVERRSGTLRGAPPHLSVELIDLPGAYSTAPSSADEAIVLDVLSGRHDPHPPDVIVSVLDATNLGRNLFLLCQVLELRLSVVVALNMIDLAERSGIAVDADALAEELGVPVVPVVATRGTGVADLRQAILDAALRTASPRCAQFPACVCAELDGLCDTVQPNAPSCDGSVRRLELLQTLLDPGGFHEQRLIAHCGKAFAEELAQRRARISASGESVVEVEARIRYAWIDRVVQRVVRRVRASEPSRSERIDRVLTHPIAGMAVLLILMALCFQAIYTWAQPLMDVVDTAFVSAGDWVGAQLPSGALRSLIVNGAVAGVGGVLVFLPQILILFLFIAILEDCGYMARAAFLFDRWMRLIGLNGKSFIPLLSSFACAVPGIMATRTIGGSRDRLITMLIAPLMSCSARLPVYTLLIGAFVPPTAVLGGWIGLQALTMLGLYAIGTIVAVAVAFVLQKTILRGEHQPFLMELPTYRSPTAKSVFFRVYGQGREFCITAGTMIFAVTVVVWALGYYPRPDSIAQTYAAKRTTIEAQFAQVPSASQDQAAAPTPEAIDEQRTTLIDQLDREEAGAYLRQSFLGRMGQWIEPVVQPLGWDWRIGTAVIASFPAREVVIATMGTIYNLGTDEDESSAALRDQIRSATWPDGRPVFNLPVALSVMVFFALCCQCGATLAVIKRETRSWRWPVFTFAYMTALAYAAAFITYQTAVVLI